jgi:hypothetical protein
MVAAFENTMVVFLMTVVAISTDRGGSAVAYSINTVNNSPNNTVPHRRAPRSGM